MMVKWRPTSGSDSKFIIQIPWEMFPGDITLNYNGYKLRILSIAQLPSLHFALRVYFQFNAQQTSKLIIQAYKVKHVSKTKHSFAPSDKLSS